jgi:hypothetical protein
MALMPIHLVVREDLHLKSVSPPDKVWDSGNWVVATDTAQQLVGKSVYLHKKRSTPSFFGGTILSYRVIDSGGDAGRVVFRFRFDESHRGVSTSRSGWGQEKKITD